MALTPAMGSKTRIMSFPLFADDLVLLECEAVSMGFSDYQRFKHVGPKRRESNPTSAI
jgi:hypothetical protein